MVLKMVDLPHIEGWDGPKKANGDMYMWGREVNGNRLEIRYLRDKITGYYVTEGSFWDVSTRIVSTRIGQSWLIQNGRKYVLDLALTTYGDIQVNDGDLGMTGFGPGEVISEDVSTPEMMAAYLEKLAE